jgi:hypothetical protein
MEILLRTEKDDELPRKGVPHSYSKSTVLAIASTG